MRNGIDPKLPVLIKIAPDLVDEEINDIASIVTRKNVNYFKIIY